MMLELEEGCKSCEQVLLLETVAYATQQDSRDNFRATVGKELELVNVLPCAVTEQLF